MNKPSPLILVVDDTEGTRYSVARVLKNDGFRVIEAANGTDALALADREIPDLAILDIHLPDMLGFEVCRRLKAAPKTALMPVLQISASFVTSKDRINGLEGGADSYLTHPVEPQVLVATVRALLRLRDLNRQVAITDERLETALHAAPISVFELDRDLRLKWIHSSTNSPDNRFAKLGARIDEMLPGPESKALIATQRHVLETGQGTKTSFRATVDNQTYFFDVVLEPSHAQDGVKGIIGVAVDVTEREHAKIEIERARDAAESANRAKSQFIANVSHEIRTPLGVILGFSDLILDSNHDNLEETLRSVSIIKRNATQLAKLIDEVLDLSKVEADRMEIESIRFDLAELLDDVTANLQLKAREKDLQLSLSYLSPLPAFIKSDPTRLRQILINMIGNAVKFTEKGSVALEVSCDRLQEGQPAVIKFAVKDTGIGISREQSEKLFHAFAQADASMTRRFGGTGLGLMLSKKLAQALGGDLVIASSEPGRGSVFEVTILEPRFHGPLLTPAKGAAPAVVPAPTTPSRVLAGRSILLVEDSPDNQLMVQRFLSAAGASVEMASDGESGVKKAVGGNYDVVLMDIQMPNMDGYEATRDLRRRGFKQPIIALTAHALKGEREKCLEAGFTDYLTKPINRAALIGKLEAL